MSAESVLELDGVTKVYGEEPPVLALQGVSFTVARGELVAIVGPSGSGKSTLLHIMGTLERPSGGVVRVGGVDAAQLDDRELSRLRAREIGFVFQQFFLAEHATVRENVADGMLYAGAPAAERYARAEEARECPRICVGMSELESHAYENAEADRAGGAGPRRRRAERARRASAARRRRRGPRRGRAGG